MPLYKDPANNLHSLDSENFEHLLPPGSVKITDAEFATLHADYKQKMQALYAERVAAMKAATP